MPAAVLLSLGVWQVKRPQGGRAAALRCANNPATRPDLPVQCSFHSAACIDKITAAQNKERAKLVPYNVNARRYTARYDFIRYDRTPSEGGKGVENAHYQHKYGTVASQFKSGSVCIHLNLGGSWRGCVMKLCAWCWILLPYAPSLPPSLSGMSRTTDDCMHD